MEVARRVEPDRPLTVNTVYKTRVDVDGRVIHLSATVTAAGYRTVSVSTSPEPTAPEPFAVASVNEPGVSLFAGDLRAALDEFMAEIDRQEQQARDQAAELPL